MLGLARFATILPAILLYSAYSLADTSRIVQHVDPVEVDTNLSLAELIEHTLQQYPDLQLLAALKQEASALQRRGESWLAAAPSVSLYYQDDAPGNDLGARELESALELPLWNWGQRDAGLQVASKAKLASAAQELFVKLQVAGLVRKALWDIQLHNIRYDMALSNFQVTEILLDAVKRRVDLGDLPRTDFLLAQGELLNKRAQLVSAEAEQMHANQHYINLTQNHKIPGNFTETQTTEPHQLEDSHPALHAYRQLIARKQAELAWVKAGGSGQTVIAIGGKTERGSRLEDDTESITFNISVPFGGGAHLAPDIAATHVELTEIISKRDHLQRQLTKELHEAKHALQVGREELSIANELKTIAEAHYKLTRLSFSEGEIDLMDLLKIQARTQKAQQHASEQAVTLQRNIALFNQALGVLP